MRRVSARTLPALLVVLASTVTALIGPAGGAQAATWDVPVVSTATAPSTLDEFEDQLMVEINKTRRAHGMRRIGLYDGCADRLAEQWGAHLAGTGLFEHRDQRQVLRRCDVAWAGENLVRGTGLTPAAMVQAWMDSPGHRAILLHGNARRAGVAVVPDEQGRLVGVLNVVRPF